MSIQYKKIPRGWNYLLSKKEIRAFIESSPGDICFVDFKGIAWHGYGKWKPNDTWCTGKISSRGTECGWKYKIEMSGLPEGLTEGRREELRNILLSEMEKFVSEFELRDLDPLTKTEDLRFNFDDNHGVLEARFSRWKLDSFDIELDYRKAWWA